VIVLGIDPGLSGALAFYGAENGQLYLAVDVPVVDGEINASELARIIRLSRARFAIIEMAQMRPGQGISSTAKFWRAYGTAIGVLGALEIGHHVVAPTRWKKHFRLSADKEEARALAIRTWPGSEAFKRKKDHGRAEAALLAKYAAETLPEARA
jgi:hypothetical protein